ncbi:MAG: hypothetical protein JXA60_08780 [Candidatus Coatesbacteria bacterium]|nr:hypothetical protein [Candidatus Coatesbacteria bacterium]
MRSLIIKYVPGAILLLLLVFGIYKNPAITEKLSAGKSQNQDKTTFSSMEAKLDSLAKTPKQTDLNPGAMCYEPVCITDYANFVCSKCNKSTILSREVVENIRNAKAMLTNIRGLKIVIDDSGFCGHCNKNKTDHFFKITIFYPDRKEPVTSKLYIHQTGILTQFLKGNLIYKGERDSESDMKTYLPLLKKILLGIEDKREQ